VNEPAQLNWLDLPPEAHWQQARELLIGLGGIDRQGHITDQGRGMSILPVHPRLAHMLMQAVSKEDKQTVADIAALLTERDPLKRHPGSMPSVDLTVRLSALTQWRQRQSIKDAYPKALQQLDRLAKQFLKLLPDKKTAHQDAGLSVGAYLAMAYPDRVAKRRSNSVDYLMTNGRGVSLPQDDALVTAQYLVIANLDAGKRDGRAWLAARIEYDEIENLFGQQIQHKRIVYWDNHHLKVVARERTFLGQVILTEHQVPLEKDDPVIDILLEQVNKQGLCLFGNIGKLDSLRARIQTLHKLKTFGDWPDVSETGLLANLDAWLVPWLDNITSLKQLRQMDLVSVFESWLGWEKLQRLNELLPETYLTPAGTQRKINYDFTEQPVLSVPLQEMLGIAYSPVIAAGQLPLVIHLLSPAGRPLQVTGDLAAFWQGAYQEVKKEMRGRYPKHYWPDDPTSAQATRFTKRQ
ncbi:MAG: ATP-dependent helicase C-terminal domain-containing protein, partial [Gammaproteobacteria bacterium]